MGIVYVALYTFQANNIATNALSRTPGMTKDRVRGPCPFERKKREKGCEPLDVRLSKRGL
jgi:hypothetical protein